MNAPSQDVKDMLEAYEFSSESFPSSGNMEDLGLVYAVNLFIGNEPSSPPDCVTIRDTSGRPPWIGLTDKGYDYPAIQITVRSSHYLKGYNLALKIKDALHGRAHEAWNGSTYELIQAMNDPALLDWDDNNRAVFFINFNIQRR
jgi:hypothetical protein